MDLATRVKVSEIQVTDESVILTLENIFFGSSFKMEVAMGILDVDVGMEIEVYFKEAEQQD